MNRNDKKFERHPVAICHLVRGPGVSPGELRTEPFSDRLSINTLGYLSLTEFSGHPRKNTNNELQIVAAIGRVPIAALLQSELKAVARQNQDNTPSSKSTISPSCFVGWQKSEVAFRSVAIAAEQTLGIAYNGITIDPMRLLGWGFFKSVEALDAGTNPARILRNITRSFERMRCTDFRLEMAKSLFASIAASGAKHPGIDMPMRMTVAADGASLLFTLDIPCDQQGAQESHEPRNLAIHQIALDLAAWLDHATSKSHSRLTGWVKQKSGGVVETGVLFDGTDTPAVLIVEPRLEQMPQVSYNVA